MEIANKQSDTQQRQIESQVMTAPSEPSVPSVVNVNVTPTETTVENTIVNEKKAVMAKILDNGDIKLEPQG